MLLSIYNIGYSFSSAYLDNNSPIENNLTNLLGLKDYRKYLEDKMNNTKKLLQQYFSDEFLHKISINDTDETCIIDSLKPSDPYLLEVYDKCRECRACELCNSATNLVFGDGNPRAKLMIIGEAPGADEDIQGKPFVGKAGQLLIKTLNQYGIKREEIYISNILKHRPPNNRNPLPAEIEACTPFLKEQIRIINPLLLVTLGNFASQFILDTKTGITKIRGMIQKSAFGIVLPMLHPSAILRGAYHLELLENDIIKAKEYIENINE